MNYNIKSIFLTGLLFFASKGLYAAPPEKPLPKSCFTYLLHQEERIDIDIERIVVDKEMEPIIQAIKEITGDFTDEAAMEKFQTNMANTMLYFQFHYGITREFIEDIMIRSSFATYLESSPQETFEDEDDDNDPSPVH